MRGRRRLSDWTAIRHVDKWVGGETYCAITAFTTLDVAAAAAAARVVGARVHGAGGVVG